MQSNDERPTKPMRQKPLRVLPGELFRFAELPPTVGFTENAESESPRRFAFSACAATTCSASVHSESSLPASRERPHHRDWPAFLPELSRSQFNEGHWVNDLSCASAPIGTLSEGLPEPSGTLRQAALCK